MHNKTQESTPLKTKPFTKTESQHENLILCLWLPSWPIQRLVAANAALRRTQIILYRNQPGRGQVVTAVSPAAELSGARPNMPLSEAKSLVGRQRRFQGFHIFEHDPHADAEALKQLAIDCAKFSSLVGIEETDYDKQQAPAALMMNVTGLTHLFGGPTGLRTQLHQHFQSLGYLVSTAIAETPGKAWGLSRFEDMPLDVSMEEASSKEPQQKNGLKRGFDSLPFDSLPVAALRLKATTVDTLRQLGIETVAQLRTLPRRGLRSRFGEEITQRLDQVDGTMPEVIKAIYPPPDYETEKFLDYPLTDRETIQVLLSRMAGELCRQMKAAARGGLVWQFDLHPPIENKQHDQTTAPHTLTVKLFQPTSSLEHLLPLLEMQLEDLFAGRSKKRRGATNRSGKKRRQNLAFQVQEIRVSVRNCVLLAERQRQLFDENPKLDKQSLAHLINRLSSRLGPQNVLRAALQSGNQAEDSFYMEPLVGQTEHGKRRRRRPRNGTSLSPLQRPLVLHSQPIPLKAITVESAVHHHANNTPKASATLLLPDSKQPLTVRRRWGPERIETAWWRGPTIRREYWRIETDSERWLWIYRDLNTRQWFLHGEF